MMAQPGARRYITLTALGCSNAMAVGATYLPQPLMRDLGQDLGVAVAEGAPAAALLGYAIGVVSLAFLSTATADRRSLLTHGSILVMALFGFAAAQAGTAALAAALLIGIGAAVSQQLLAAAIKLGTAEQRGRAIAVILTSALLGILLIRTGADLLVTMIGWRLTACVIAVPAGLSIIAAAIAAGSTAGSASSARPVPGSTFQLLRQQPTLRAAALTQAGLFTAFQACWSSLPLATADIDLRLLATLAAGGCGIIGAASAGLLVSRFGARAVAHGFAALAVAAIVAAAFGGLPGLVLGLLLIEFTTQVCLVANHARAQSTANPEMRVQVAALVTFLGFAAGACGSWLAVSSGRLDTVLLPCLVLVLLGVSEAQRRPAMPMTGTTSRRTPAPEPARRGSAGLRRWRSFTTKPVTIPSTSKGQCHEQEDHHAADQAHRDRR